MGTPITCVAGSWVQSAIFPFAVCIINKQPESKSGSFYLYLISQALALHGVLCVFDKLSHQGHRLLRQCKKNQSKRCLNKSVLISTDNVN